MPQTSSKEWVTTKTLAERLNRPHQTVKRWCWDGTIITFGYSLYKDLSGKYWIGIPLGALPTIANRTSITSLTAPLT